MTKNKAKAANNRAKKAKERTKDRQLQRAREAAVFKAKRETSLVSFVENPQTGYEFWYLHGLNYILSSYETGLWEPLFPEVYAGKLLSRAEVFKRIMAKHFDDKERELSDAGTKAILWSSLKPKEMFSLVVRIRKAGWDADEDPKAPMAPHVWEFMHNVMNAFLQTVNKKSLKDGKLSIDSEKYGDYLHEAIASTVAERSGVAGPEI